MAQPRRSDRTATVQALRDIHKKHWHVCESMSVAMSNERAAKYHDFMKRAVSHKGGQAIHRILKKMPDSMARPVSKKRMDTTEDQHHADEQISQLVCQD